MTVSQVQQRALIVIGALVATLGFCLKESMPLALAGIWIGFMAGLGLGLSHERLDKWLNRIVK